MTPEGVRTLMGLDACVRSGVLMCEYLPEGSDEPWLNVHCQDRANHMVLNYSGCCRHDRDVAFLCRHHAEMLGFVTPLG